MGLSQEEVRIRFGVEQEGSDVGTAAMLAKQGEAAIKFQTIWAKAAERALAAQKSALAMWNEATAKALADQAAMEKAANEASLARLERNEAEKAAIRRTWMEEQAAQAAIARGSGGYGAIVKGGEEEAGGGLKKRLEHDAETLGAGAIGAGGAHLAAGPFGEAMVLVREAARGAWTRMTSSFLRLLSLMGMTASTVLGSIPIVGAGALAIWGNIYMKRQLNQMQGHYGSDQAMIEARSKMAEDLQKEIAKMNAGGLLSKDQNSQIGGLFAQNSFRGLEGIRKILGPLLPQGFATKIETNEEKIKTADDLSKREQSALDELVNKKRTQKQLEDDIALKRNQQIDLVTQMAQMDQSSVAWHEAKAKLLGVELDLQKDLNQKQKDADDQAKATADWKKWSDSAARTFMRDTIGAAMDQAEFPSIEELAGKRFERRLKRRFNVNGNTPFSAAAQDYELAKKAQIWDRANGFGADANIEQRHMQEDRDYLVKNGAANPQMMMEKLVDNTTKMREVFDALEASGILVKGTD